jgi:hypothetical protein
MRLIGFLVIAAILSGCAAAPMVLSAVGGGLTIAKDVLDVDVSLRNLIAVKQGQGPGCIPTAPSSAQLRN